MFGKQLSSFLKKLNIYLTYDPVIQISGIYPRNKIMCQHKVFTQIFLVGVLIIAENWKQPNVHQQVNGQNCGIYIQ